MVNKAPVLTGNVVYPGNEGYAEDRLIDNKRIDTWPQVIVFCEREEDVENAVRWAVHHKFPIRMRSGRHNYDGLCTADHAVILDVSQMKTITVDQTTETAEIQTGAKLAHVYQELFEHGYTIPGGTCPPVSIAGLTQGGGVGLSHRLMGLTCDSLLEATVVTADGQTVVATADNEHRDLLWALKGGGGGNFGVVTRYKFKLHPIDKVAIFSITWAWEDMAEVIKFWTKWAPETDNRLTSYIRFHAKSQDPTKNSDSVVAIGQFVGTSQELMPVLEPLTRIGCPVDVTVKWVDYLDAVKHFAGELYSIDEEAWEKLAQSMGLAATTPDVLPLMKQVQLVQQAADVRPHKFTVHYRKTEDAGGEPPRYKITSSFGREPFGEPAVETILAYLEGCPSEASFLSIHSLGGEMAKPREAAFAHRDKKMVLQLQAFWFEEQEDQRNIEWVERFRTAMLSYTEGAFVNFMDTGIADRDVSYYGGGFERLKEVKGKYDPQDVFSFEMSIPVKK
ncbi:MAG TPA: FAD-dependent oxidoreductase [Bacilli bacterium]|nr:FAD-dependent oxidoreductase [Bacilli bacterium]